MILMHWVDIESGKYQDTLSRVRNYVEWYCPACKEIHWVWANSKRAIPNKNWSYNGNDKNPTLTPSVNISAGPRYRCHSTMTAGKIHYCDDCSHNMRGQVVPMVEIKLVSSTLRA